MRGFMLNDNRKEDLIRELQATFNNSSTIEPPAAPFTIEECHHDGRRFFRLKDISHERTMYYDAVEMHDI